MTAVSREPCTPYLNHCSLLSNIPPYLQSFSRLEFFWPGYPAFLLYYITSDSGYLTHESLNMHTDTLNFPCVLLNKYTQDRNYPVRVKAGNPKALQDRLCYFKSKKNMQIER